MQSPMLRWDELWIVVNREKTENLKDGYGLWQVRCVALASFLMYQSALADASMPVKYVYMYITYILWGSICYTGINIPYGSMASAITDKPEERTALSTFRSIGATLANLIIGVGGPMLIYTTDANGAQVIRNGGAIFPLLAGIFSVSAIICYIVCYKCTTERVKIERDPNEQKITLKDTIKAVFTSGHCWVSWQLPYSCF